MTTGLGHGRDAGGWGSRRRFSASPRRNLGNSPEPRQMPLSAPLFVIYALSHHASIFPLPGKMRQKISQCGMLQLFRTSDRTWSVTAARTSRHTALPEFFRECRHFPRRYYQQNLFSFQFGTWLLAVFD